MKRFQRFELGMSQVFGNVLPMHNVRRKIPRRANDRYGANVRAIQSPAVDAQLVLVVLFQFLLLFPRTPSIIKARMCDLS
jgi:hypothetical protein